MRFGAAGWRAALAFRSVLERSLARHFAPPQCLHLRNHRQKAGQLLAHSALAERSAAPLARGAFRSARQVRSAAARVPGCPPVVLCRKAATETGVLPLEEMKFETTAVARQVLAEVMEQGRREKPSLRE